MIPANLFDKSPQVVGTMKQGYLPQSKDVVYFIPKKQHLSDASFIQKQFRMLHTMKQKGLPSLRRIQLIPPSHSPYPYPILLEQYVPDARIIKPHQDLQELLGIIDEFASTHGEQATLPKIDAMIQSIQTMIRILAQHRLVIEDFQWLVSKKDLSIRVVDPFDILQMIDSPTTRWRRYGETQYTTKGVWRPLAGFDEQQMHLFYMIGRLLWRRYFVSPPASTQAHHQIRIKPRHFPDTILRMMDEFASTHGEEPTLRKLDAMINLIQTMIRVLAQHRLVIEDLQWWVSPEHLSIRMVDPVKIMPIDLVSSKNARVAFDKQQMNLMHLVSRLILRREKVRLSQQQVVQAPKRKRRAVESSQDKKTITRKKRK